MDAIVTRAITCQGRDHIVNVQFWAENLVVVNGHFEPELTLRRLREKLCLTFIFVNQREEGSMCGIKLSPTVTRERPPCVIPFFSMFLRLLKLITLGGTLLSLGSYARCQGLIVSLLICLWLRRVTFAATLQSFCESGEPVHSE